VWDRCVFVAVIPSGIPSTAGMARLGGGRITHDLWAITTTPAGKTNRTEHVSAGQRCVLTCHGRSP